MDFYGHGQSESLHSPHSHSPLSSSTSLCLQPVIQSAALVKHLNWSRTQFQHRRCQMCLYFLNSDNWSKDFQRIDASLSLFSSNLPLCLLPWCYLPAEAGGLLASFLSISMGRQGEINTWPRTVSLTLERHQCPL